MNNNSAQVTWKDLLLNNIHQKEGFLELQNLELSI